MRQPRTAVATDDAADALTRILRRDTVPSRDVVVQMKAERFSEKVIRSAREKLGVISKRSGFGKQMASYWKLPDGAQVPEDDATRALAQPFVPIHAQPSDRASMGTNEEEGHEWRNGTRTSAPENQCPYASVEDDSEVFDGRT